MENKLQDQIKVLIDKADNKELIDGLIELNNTANNLVTEHEELLAKHDELKASYKQAVMHTSFKEAPKSDPVQTKTVVDFDSFLNNYVKK